MRSLGRSRLALQLRTLNVDLARRLRRLAAVDDVMRNTTRFSLFALHEVLSCHLAGTSREQLQNTAKKDTAAAEKASFERVRRRFLMLRFEGGSFAVQQAEASVARTTPSPAGLEVKGQRSTDPEPERACAMAVEGAGQLMVKIQQGMEVLFKVKRSTPLRKLVGACCSRPGLKASQVRFMVDGVHIAPDDTAEVLGLQDGVLIVVALEGSDAARGKSLLFLAAGRGGRHRRQRMSR